MPKEILLYTDFYRFTAEEFVREMNASMGEKVVVRLFSSGGNPEAGYAMIAKMQEHGKVSLKVDGYAHSMAAFMLTYAEDVEVLDISEFVFHRAAYYDETNLTESEVKDLNRINTFLRKGLENKVGAEKFQSVTGVSLDELFSMNSRIDVSVTAEQAKEMGLISSINPVSERMMTAIHKREKMQASATKRLEVEAKATVEKPQQKVSIKINNMTVDQLRSENPGLYNEVLALGVAQEKDRAGAWLAFVDIDPEAVAKGINEGKALSQTATAEFIKKGMSAQALSNIEGDSTKVEAKKEEEEKAKTEQEAKVAEFASQSKFANHLTPDAK